MAFYQFKSFLEKGLVPLKDESYLTDGLPATLKPKFLKNLQLLIIDSPKTSMESTARSAKKQFRNLLEKGVIPLKDDSYLTNGYLDTSSIQTVTQSFDWKSRTSVTVSGSGFELLHTLQ
ncbi:hypothetical protein POM88_019173 [Heracleum sosnowskyi]|uniref:Uncharacterized protein n=1 Tax=Heracleum sosnowskyi TaxID=360622 RepID=A0AAD8ISE8_9APIA|nr:hypothetical protein POM88_019173 [Heracleum sosnowskyi]